MKDDNIYIENCQNNRFEIPVTTVEKENMRANVKSIIKLLLTTGEETEKEFIQKEKQISQ